MNTVHPPRPLPPLPWVTEAISAARSAIEAGKTTPGGFTRVLQSLLFTREHTDGSGSHGF